MIAQIPGARLTEFLKRVDIPRHDGSDAAEPI